MRRGASRTSTSAASLRPEDHPLQREVGEHLAHQRRPGKDCRLRAHEAPYAGSSRACSRRCTRKNRSERVSDGGADGKAFISSNGNVLPPRGAGPVAEHAGRGLGQ